MGVPLRTLAVTASTRSSYHEVAPPPALADVVACGWHGKFSKRWSPREARHPTGAYSPRSTRWAARGRGPPTSRVIWGSANARCGGTWRTRSAPGRSSCTAMIRDMTFRVTIAVRADDLDVNGHVHSPAYLAYADHARWSCVQAAGIDPAELTARRIGPVNLETTVRFRRERRNGEVEVGCGSYWRELAARPELLGLAPKTG